jgi:hypothetical protein
MEIKENVNNGFIEINEIKKWEMVTHAVSE